MARPGYAPMSPLSAALTLAIWHEQHGRWPCYSDCTGQDGLKWHTTYLKIFQAQHWPEVLAQVQALCSQPLSTLYGRLPSGMAPRLKPCANKPDCSALIVDEGCHIRYCEECRKRQRGEGETYTIGYLDASCDESLGWRSFRARTMLLPSEDLTL